MDNDRLIHEVLMQVFPIECAIVSSSVVQDIIDGDVDFEEAAGGSYLDLRTTIDGLSAGVTLIQIATQTHSIIRNETGKRPSPKEVADRLSLQQSSQELIDSNEKHQELLLEVCRRLESSDTE